LSSPRVPTCVQPGPWSPTYPATMPPDPVVPARTIRPPDWTATPSASAYPAEMLERTVPPLPKDGSGLPFASTRPTTQ